jgi:hypothetical protein
MGGIFLSFANWSDQNSSNYRQKHGHLIAQRLLFRNGIDQQVGRFSGAKFHRPLGELGAKV